jgi:PST family polysaccharide transporter
MLNLMNMIIPLIILPFLTLKLGLEGYGQWSFYFAFASLQSLFIGFGFDLSATKEIASVRDTSEKVNLIFWNVLYSKLVIFTFVLILTSLYFFIFESEIEYQYIYLLVGILIGNVFFPNWLFQGMEEMVIITGVNFFFKTIYVVLLFVTIHDTNDIFILAILTSTIQIAIGFTGFFIAIRRYDLRFIHPNIRRIYSVIINSSFYFLSRLSNNSLRYIITLTIGYVFNEFYLGIYAISEKLYFAFNSFLSGVTSQTIFPYMANKKDLKIFKNIFKIVILSTILLSLLYIFISDKVLRLIISQEEAISYVVDLSSIMILTSFMNSISTLIGFPLLANFGFVNYANKSIIIAFLITMLLMLIFYLMNLDFLVFALSVPIYMAICMSLRVIYLRKSKIFETYD